MGILHLIHVIISHVGDVNVHGVAPWATGEPWHLKYPAFHAGMCARELCPCFDNRFVQGFRIAHLQTCEFVLFFLRVRRQANPRSLRGVPFCCRFSVLFANAVCFCGAPVGRAECHPLSSWLKPGAVDRLSTRWGFGLPGRMCHGDFECTRLVHGYVLFRCLYDGLLFFLV